MIKKTSLRVSTLFLDFNKLLNFHYLLIKKLKKTTISTALLKNYNPTQALILWLSCYKQKKAKLCILSTGDYFLGDLTNHRMIPTSSYTFHTRTYSSCAWSCADRDLSFPCTTCHRCKWNTRAFLSNARLRAFSEAILSWTCGRKRRIRTRFCCERASELPTRSSWRKSCRTLRKDIFQLLIFQPLLWDSFPFSGLQWVCWKFYNRLLESSKLLKGPEAFLKFSKTQRCMLKSVVIFFS